MITDPDWPVAPAGDGALATAWESLLPRHPELGRALVARWDEPHRHYHDRRHLARVLIMIDRFAEPRHDRRAVALAAWYHDAIYRIGSPDNETDSAELARSELTGPIGADAAAEVARLVRLTAGHRVTDLDHDGALLCDADLAILAAPGPEYRDYVTAVRREYAEIDDVAFARGRGRILRDLLARPLFRTARAAAWEPRARANLSAELAELDARS